MQFGIAVSTVAVLVHVFWRFTLVRNCEYVLRSRS